MEGKTIKIGEKTVTINVGDLVEVTEPKHNDSLHEHSFVGYVAEINYSGYIVVEDSDGDFFCMEDDEISEKFNS